MPLLPQGQSTPVTDSAPSVRRSRRLAALIALAAVPLLAACTHTHYVTHHVVVHHVVVHHVVVHHCHRSITGRTVCS